MKIRPRNWLVISVLLFVASIAQAADIFVSDNGVRGSDAKAVGALVARVKRAVSSMPEHRLVRNEDAADFTLKPWILRGRNGTADLVRIDKIVKGRAVSTGEMRLDDINRSRRAAIIAVRGAVDPGYRPVAGEGSQSAFTSPAEGDLRAPSPASPRSAEAGYFQLGVGPAFGLGMDSAVVLTDVNVAYAMPVSPAVAAKGFGDFNFGIGDEEARFIDIGIGLDYVPRARTRGALTVAGPHPYLTADLGFAFARDTDGDTAEAPAVGIGGGFKFAARDLNLDVNLHYAILTAENDGNVPSVLGFRAALNF